MVSEFSCLISRSTLQLNPVIAQFNEFHSIIMLEYTCPRFFLSEPHSVRMKITGLTTVKPHSSAFQGTG